VDSKDVSRSFVDRGFGHFRGASPLGLPYTLARGGPRILGDDDATANRQYIKHVVLDVDSPALRGVPSDRELGRRYGLEWAEGFHYIGPPVSRLQQYIAENAVAL